MSQSAASVTCEYTVTPDRTSFSKDGGTGTATVDTAGPCGWTAASDAPWLTIASGAQGTGTGVVSYSVARNSTSRIAVPVSSSPRAGSTSSSRVILAAVRYSVAPVELNVCMSVPDELTTMITTQGSCPWTATTGAPWLTVVGGQSGTGSGSVRFRVSENWEAPRDAPIQVRWPTPTAGQNVRVFQAGCLYSVTRSAIAMPVSGGSSTFDVLQQSVPNTCGGATQNACVWTAQADVPWITIVTSMPQAGDNRVSFTAAANTSGVARMGTFVSATRQSS